MNSFNESLKANRNELCPCGSGKKYKKCCMDSSGEVIDFAWRKIRQTEVEIVDKHLMPFVSSHLPAHTTETALKEFLQGIEPSDEEVKLIFANIFIPWFCFNWIPECENIPHKEIALQYLDRKAYMLSSYQKKMIEALTCGYFSFYIVLEVVFEKSVRLKDIFLNSEHIIKEKLGTHCLKKGSIVFMRIINLEGQSIGTGIFPFAIPAQHHTHLIDLREIMKKLSKKKKLTSALVKSCDDQLRLKALNFALPSQQKMPEFRNTDDEAFQLCSVFFKSFLNPKETLKILSPLSFHETYKSILNDAEKSHSGEIQSIKFSWSKPDNKKIKSWDNTILGHIEITDDRIKIDVNSYERAETIKDLITALLGHGKNGIYQNTVIENMEQRLLEGSDTVEEPLETLNNLPEMQEYLQELGKKTWMDWLDTKLPVLNNLTPRKAVKTRVGQEKVEALLLMCEENSAQRPNDPMNPDIDFLRKELKLQLN